MNKKQARKLGKGMLLGKEDPAFSLNHCFLRRSLEVRTKSRQGSWERVCCWVRKIQHSL